jgi:fused signal recognition particle receptor
MFGFLKKSAGEQSLRAGQSRRNETADRPAGRRGGSDSRPVWRARARSSAASSNRFSRAARSTTNCSKIWKACLLSSDVGLDATQHLLYQLKMRAKRDSLDTPEAIQRALSDIFHELLLAARRSRSISPRTARSSS